MNAMENGERSYNLDRPAGQTRVEITAAHLGLLYEPLVLFLCHLYHIYLPLLWRHGLMPAPCVGYGGRAVTVNKMHLLT
jgi:hypothetical protein